MSGKAEAREGYSKTTPEYELHREDPWGVGVGHLISKRVQHAFRRLSSAGVTFGAINESRLIVDSTEAIGSLEVPGAVPGA